MRVFGLISLLFIASSAHAVELKDLSLKLDPAKNKAPNLDVKNAEVAGTCDGKKYTSQAELEGCQKNVSARQLGSSPGYPHMPLAPKPALEPRNNN